MEDNTLVSYNTVPGSPTQDVLMEFCAWETLAYRRVSYELNGHVHTYYIADNDIGICGFDETREVVEYP